MEIITLNKKPFQYLPPEGGSLLSRTQKLLRRSGLRARKGLAQHFLVDKEALDIIFSLEKEFLNIVVTSIKVSFASTLLASIFGIPFGC